MTWWRDARRLAGGLRRRLRPSPDEAARRQLEAEAARVGRHQSGRVQLAGLDIQYVDALSTVPQWDDLFVRGNLRVSFDHASPRVLDCGANIGLATLWLKRAHPGARITAFEADPAIAAVLARNLAANGAGDVEVVRAAVWSSATTLRFRAEGTDSGAVDEVAADTPGAAIAVPAVRLRDWVTREPIDLLKLDIEGAELEVLRDLAPVLDRVRALQMEVHDFALAERRLPACLELLTAAGFDYTLTDLHQASWRTAPPAAGPFPGVAGWVILVRAWPRPRAS
jgi:FkbM family methyltransferase